MTTSSIHKLLFFKIMHHRIRDIVIATSVTVCLLLPSATPSSAKNEKKVSKIEVYQLAQSCHASGSFQTQYNEKAIRLDFPHQKFSMVAQAPDWTVYIFNDKRHLYTSYKFSDFKGFRKDTLFAVWFRDHKWVKFGPNQLLKPYNLTLESYKIDQKSNVELGTQEKKAVMRCTPDLPWPKPIAHIFSFAVKVPLTTKTPIDGNIPRTMMGADSLKKYFLTEKFEKTLVPRSRFEVPKGFQKAKSETDVTHDEVESLIDII